MERTNGKMIFIQTILSGTKVTKMLKLWKFTQKKNGQMFIFILITEMTVLILKRLMDGLKI